ncbi:MULTISPECIES: hypothetical protein [Paracoccus]|uniref:hypothetical protein n=1 Tax=Paracoccus TaxID=265 RepID=UPI002B80E1B2|nr:hypothetical protein [Paracoccus solventivorans]HMM08525.1 hypothetical protein [Paracoccus solventivorans]
MTHHHERAGSILPYVALAGVLGWAAAMFCRQGHHSHRRLHRRGRLAAISDKAAAEGEATEDCDFVRPAGRGAMRDPPRRWDEVDEASDASFPSSDPPGNY